MASTRPASPAAALPLVHARVVVAGTWDRLHPGHFALLHTAFLHGQTVEVWCTDDALCAVKSVKVGQRLQSLVARMRQLYEWLTTQTSDSIADFADHYGADIAELAVLSPKLIAASAASSAAAAEGPLPDSGSDAGSEAVAVAAAAAGTASGEAGAGLRVAASGGGGSDAAAMRRHQQLAPVIVLDEAHPYRGRFALFALHDGVGLTVHDPTYTAIVCSEETRSGCEEINARRAAAGMRPLAVYTAPLVRDRTGAKLSSTQLRAALAASGDDGSDHDAARR